MALEVFLYVLLYHSGQFFYRKRGHINRNVRGLAFGRRDVTQAIAPTSVASACCRSDIAWKAVPRRQDCLYQINRGPKSWPRKS